MQVAISEWTSKAIFLAHGLHGSTAIAGRSLEIGGGPTANGYF